MPKASRVGKFRQAAAAAKIVASAPATEKAQDANDGVPTGGGTAALSKGQKKRMAKREQYLRKERLVMSSLLLKKQEDQAKRIDGLDAIKEALLATTKKGNDKTSSAHNQKQQAHAQNFLKSQKSRQTLLQRESNQLQLVVQHPAFQNDPLATIREHLTNKLAPQAAQREQEHAQHEREQREAQKNAPPKRKSKKHRARPTRSRA